MIRLSTRYAAPNTMRNTRPLTNDELMRVVPSAFSVEKHESRSERYTYIPLLCWINCVRKVSNPFMPDSHGYAIRSAGTLPNT